MSLSMPLARLAPLCLVLTLSAHAVVAGRPPPTFECLIKPSRDIQLGSPVPGLLEKVLVERGTPVKAGQLVATLDSRAQQANLAVAEFKAASDLEQGMRRSALEIDRRIERRIAPLVKQDAASSLDLDRARREARLSAWYLKIAQSDRKLRALEKTRAATAVALRQIRSPIDGVVAARLHQPGEYIDGEPLLRLVRLDPLHVEAIVPMPLFGRIHPGMRARVVPEFDDFPAAEARVQVIDPLGDAASGTFGIRLVLPNPDRRIPAGIKCRLELLEMPAPSVAARAASGEEVVR